MNPLASLQDPEKKWPTLVPLGSPHLHGGDRFRVSLRDGGSAEHGADPALRGPPSCSRDRHGQEQSIRGPSGRALISGDLGHGAQSRSSKLTNTNRRTWASKDAPHFLPNYCSKVTGRPPRTSPTLRHAIAHADTHGLGVLSLPAEAQPGGWRLSPGQTELPPAP